MSASMRMRTPSIVPSERTAASTSAVKPRPCDASVLSERCSVHLTGAPSCTAAYAAATSSGQTSIFRPKPPPTSGVMTRTSRSPGSSIARNVLTRCGTCVDVQTVTRPLSASGATTMPRHSIGIATRRGISYEASTIASAFSNASATLPSPASVRMTTFVPMSGCSGLASDADSRGSSRGGSGS